MRIQANIKTLDILIHIIVWMLLTIITFGFGIFFFPYYFARFIINRCSVVNEQGAELHLTCHNDISGSIGNIILWIIIIFITFGLAYPFYFYKVWNYSLNNTTCN